MSDITPLDDILNEPVAEPETKAEAIIDPPSGIADPPSRLRDEHGRFVKQEETGEKADSGPPPQEQEPGRVPVAALQDERQKRQQLEARLAELERSIPKQPPAPAPDVFDDPQGHQAYVIEQAVAKVMEQLQPTVQHQGVMTRAEVSEMLARQRYEDYDATVEVFKEAMEANPFLLAQLQQAPDPATFAYNAGKQYQAAKSLGSELPPSREQIEAELREKIMAEIGVTRPAVPSTLADSRSVASRSGPAWTGPTPLGDILSR